jgi:hypothetical protein
MNRRDFNATAIAGAILYWLCPWLKPEPAPWDLTDDERQRLKRRPEQLGTQRLTEAGWYESD